MPPELRYLASWVTSDLAHCYQVMECNDRIPLDDWIAKWSDIVDFEVIPVLSSDEAAHIPIGTSAIVPSAIDGTRSIEFAVAKPRGSLRAGSIFSCNVSTRPVADVRGSSENRRQADIRRP